MRPFALFVFSPFVSVTKQPFQFFFFFQGTIIYLCCGAEYSAKDLHKAFFVGGPKVYLHSQADRFPS